VCASAGRVINHVWGPLYERATLVTWDIFGAPQVPGPPANSSLNYLLNSHSRYVCVSVFFSFYYLLHNARESQVPCEIHGNPTHDFISVRVRISSN
jgi:hypothetical protein